ncbi:MAG: methyltransferase domain-containing protein [Streptosporangiales bacterium]|nr:methyltransferase domain-containing protein [Streptosporangiales bacterium]
MGPTGSVDGVDLAPAMVALTSADIEKRGVANARVRVGDAAAPDFAPGGFDAVLGGFMMFLLPDPAAALDAYASLLVRGGRLAFSTYGQRDQHDAARAILRRWAGDPPPARVKDVFDDPDAIAELLASHGFRDIDVAAVEKTTRFETLDHWWAWAWSVAFRSSLERIPRDHVEDAQAEVAHALADARRDDGSYETVTGVLSSARCASTRPQSSYTSAARTRRATARIRRPRRGACTTTTSSAWSPAAVVDVGVVAGADQGGVVDVDGAAVGPPGEVVRFGVLRWRVAPVDHTAAVAGDQCPTQRWWGEALVPAVVQDLPVVPEHREGGVGLARGLQQFVDGDGFTVVQPRHA